MPPAMSKLTVVVPCYNEAERLDTAAFVSFVDGRSDVVCLRTRDISVASDRRSNRLVVATDARQLLTESQSRGSQGS